MGENKFETTKLLQKTLQSTRQFEDLKSLQYRIWEDGEEIVEAEFENGLVTSVCVTADSGVALIRDVMRGLE